MDGEQFALVTGGGAGHRQGDGDGAGARRLARRARRPAARARSTRSRARSASRPARHRRTPATSAIPEAVKGLFATIEQGFGRLDLLFNNAGPGAPAVPLDELTFAQWKAVVDVNLNGAFLCAQGAFGLMKRQKPAGRAHHQQRLDLGPRRRGRSRAPYTATKHAITGLTKSIALDGRAHDIACGQIDIGNALTEMARKMTQGVPQADGRIAIEPTMDVEEVARGGRPHGEPAAVDQHPHHDDHGDQDAVRRAGVGTVRRVGGRNPHESGLGSNPISLTGLDVKRS